MNQKILLLAGIGVLVASEVPIRAQELTDATEYEIERASNGIRVAEASNGFQLVEHGLWPSPEGLVASRTDADDAAPSSPPRGFQATAGTGTSSFRRASYLPHVYAAEVRLTGPH